MTLQAYIDNVRAKIPGRPEHSTMNVTSDTMALPSPAARIDRYAGVAAACAVAAASAFLALLVALHVLRPDLEPSWHMVSEYAVGPMGWLMGAAFLLLAAALWAAAVAVMHGARGWLAMTGVALLAIGGLGAAMGGLFPMDPVGTPAERMTRSGMLHGVSFMLGVPGTLLGMTLLTAHLWHRPDWRSGRPRLLAAVGLVWLTMIVFGVSMAAFMSQGASGPEFVIGWQNRALVTAWALWILAVGVHARTAAT